MLDFCPFLDGVNVCLFFVIHPGKFGVKNVCWNRNTNTGGIASTMVFSNLSEIGSDQELSKSESLNGVCRHH